MASISTTSEILESVLTLAEIKERVYSLVSRFTPVKISTPKALKVWCDENLEDLPAEFNLRARTTWEALKVLIERYAYKQEQETRQEAALEEWEALETENEEERQEEAIAQVAFLVESVRSTYDLENANRFFLVQVRSDNSLAYAETVSNNYYASYFALDGEVWDWYTNLQEIERRVPFYPVLPDCIAAACALRME